MATTHTDCDILDALLDIPTFARIRLRLREAIAAGHPVVLLLGETARLTTLLLDAVARDLTEAGRAVHRAQTDPFRRVDLAQADPRIVVAIDRADRLSRPALLAIDEHLRQAQATQLLLAGHPSFRALTEAAGLSSLHFAPFVVVLPRLPAGDAATYLREQRATQQRPQTFHPAWPRPRRRPSCPPAPARRPPPA